jgi:hypothetical protein
MSLIDKPRAFLHPSANPDSAAPVATIGDKFRSMLMFGDIYRFSSNVTFLELDYPLKPV